MKPLKFFLLNIILLFAVSEAVPQVAYNDYVAQLMELVNPDTVRKYERELSGDTSCIIGGSLYTIVSRYYAAAGNIKAAEYIYEKFQGFGLTTWYNVINSTITNVLAKKTGTKYPNQYFIICGHYDDMPSGTSAPGADDNASGIVCVMEAARILKNIDFPYTIVFAAWDEEERGLYGSKAYADTAARIGDSIVGVLNLDMISYDGNSDGALDVHTNAACTPLASEFAQIVTLYQPTLVPQVTTSLNGGSDHQSFLNKGYKAILSIEDNSDFTPYYHTINDKFNTLNFPYFIKMIKAAIAGIITWAGDYKINIVHTPLNSGPVTTERIVTAVIKSSLKLGTGIASPKLFYKINDGSFVMVSHNYLNLDTFRFTIPGQLMGTTVKYYIAAQDSAGTLTATLPSGGSGYNPPGSIPPPEQFEYQVLNVNIVSIGTGTASIGYPYYTYYEDSRTLMLYKASEIISSGGSAGNIFKIGFNVTSVSSQTMNGFNVKMQNYSTSTVTGWINTGWATVYSGTYTVPGTGWQFITLQTPFLWNGIDNLLIEICYDNSSWSSNSLITGFTPYAGLIYHNHTDGGVGCSLTSSSTVSARPNIKMYINTSPQNISLNLKAYLEGFWNGATQVSDTIKVYLANSSVPYAFADSQTVVLSASGTSEVLFTNASSGSYYIVIKHRNHLETWSALPQTLIVGSPLSYDFTNTQAKAYGNNLVFSNNSWCIYCGDINRDGFIDLLDMIPIDNDAYNYVTGWVVTDLNGDLFVDLLDMIFVDNNSYNYVGVMKPGGNVVIIKKSYKKNLKLEYYKTTK